MRTATAQAQHVEPPPCAKADGSAGVRWIVNAGSLHHSVSVIPIEQQQRYFGSPCTFMVGKLKTPPYVQWNAIGTISIRSASEIDRCCDEGVGAVMYDPEKWQFTPEEEQRNPGEYACKIADLVHAQHRLLIVAPAADLVGGGPDRFDRFLRAKIAGSVAKCADVYEIQAQGAELDARDFASYVRRAAQQARRANPNIILLAGISTNPTGRSVTAKELFACVQAISDVVSGYWLNIPAGGAACPTCGEPKPEVAAELLQMMSAAGR
ncbi:hypothetical protein P8935_02615 [Telmatobacter sp. DSM 110680]|uniref:Uncharacterized protein n=1 Tax=Telmatobacter sp. DSM 110680 TaxID=3036704 RepID=A0AAU7DKH5_9BACT